MSHELLSYAWISDGLERYSALILAHSWVGAPGETPHSILLQLYGLQTALQDVRFLSNDMLALIVTMIVYIDLHHCTACFCTLCSVSAKHAVHHMWRMGLSWSVSWRMSLSWRMSRALTVSLTNNVLCVACPARPVPLHSNHVDKCSTNAKAMHSYSAVRLSLSPAGIDSYHRDSC